MVDTKSSFTIKKVKGEDLNESNIGQFLPRGQENLDTVLPIVREILSQVKIRGNEAILEYTRKFDKLPDGKSLEVTATDIDNAFQHTSPELIVALKKAKENIEKFHKAQIRDEWFIETSNGVKTGQIMRPLQRVGLYIPGGQAVYPSSVLMTAAVAKIAGVKELILCSPPQKDGEIASAILVAAKICGVDKIFRCGGAQAVAGMAYGTKTIPKVQKIVGPGNKWVAAAKQLVNDVCAIDNPAGPSEILLVVDENSDPLWSAYDLLAQAEHGPDNVSVLLAPSEAVANPILDQLKKIVSESPRNAIIADNLTRLSLVIVEPLKIEMIRIINLIATEHLHLHISNAKEWLPEINNAGAIFLGPYSPVPLGDYCAGTNHVLPTVGYARFYSGLSTFDFMKMIDILDCSQGGLKNLAPTLKEIAEFEGLIGHRDAVLARIEKKP
jgi:histidinol dehydrogenase